MARRFWAPEQFFSNQSASVQSVFHQWRRHRPPHRCVRGVAIETTQAAISAVQFGQRFAASGISRVQNGQGGDVGVTGAGLAYQRLTIRTIMNTAAATIRNAMTLFTNVP